jgi:succinate dehydrogenase / fumarate reductase flavoprotein subunit/fumarate reductase flavoprotein subunit
MYRISAPAREKTGDGVAMCMRAGLELRDMEMMQFHPTGLLAGESRLTGSVLEEGLRGAGAHLLNALGERYMTRYDPVSLERATRDVVARAGYMEITEGRGTPAGGVFIDVSHLGVHEVESRFPGMVERTRQIGSDLARGPVEISPTAHFHMGGVIIDPDCRTSVDGLLVAGEDAGGTHGANRLGGNGVAESTVYGCRAGDTAARIVRERTHAEIDKNAIAVSLEAAVLPLTREQGVLPFGLTRQLNDAMWEGCGVVRSREGLQVTSRKLDSLEEQLEQVCVPGVAAFNPAWQEALDLGNQITVARAVVESALVREETRGSHARSDFPEQRDKEWLRYLALRQTSPHVLEIVPRPVEFTRKSPSASASKISPS